MYHLPLGILLANKVPIMTSNTAPSGEVISTYNGWGSHYPYCAFDNNSSTFYSSGNAPDRFIGYKFTSAIAIKSAYISATHWGNNANSITEAIEASNDNTEYVELYRYSIEKGQTINTKYALNNSIPYLYYRIRCISGIADGGYTETDMLTIQFYGRQNV